MTELLLQFGWLVVRITVLAVMAVMLARWTARRGARSAVVVLTGATIVLLVVTVAAFQPLPDSCRWSPPLFEFEGVVDRVAADGAGPGCVSGSAAASASDSPVAPAAAEPEADGLTLVRALNMLGRWHAQTPPSDDWQHCAVIVLGIYTLGTCVAGGHLLAGWLAVMALRRRSRPITDTALLELADSLRIALGCSSPCQLSECDEPGLAATFGWWRPVVFLPPEWRSWSECERRAVLAHELAHVHHRDYPSALLAGCCRALHFYHPLVRSLTSQLRWQQEVAADALAATAVGDRTQYLKALASLALRLPARKSAGAMAWSAMNGGTLLRRICMLRGTEKSRPLGWSMRALLIGLLAGTALLLCTLGSPAQPPKKPALKPAPYELGYLPADATGFIALRPAEIMQQPGMDKVGGKLREQLKMLKTLGIDFPEAFLPENIEQIVADLHVKAGDKGKPGSLGLGTSSLLVRLTHDFDGPAIFKKLVKQQAKFSDQGSDRNFGEIKEIRKGDVIFYEIGGAPIAGVALYFHVPDSRTIVFTLTRTTGRDEGKALHVFDELVRNVATNRQRDWGNAWKKVEQAPIVAILNNQDQQTTKQFAKEIEAKDLQVLAKIERAAVGVELGDGRPVRLALDVTSADEAAEVEKTMDGYARQALEILPLMLSDKDDELTIVLMKLLAELLQSRKVQKEGASLEWSGYTAMHLPGLIKAFESSFRESPIREVPFAGEDKPRTIGDGITVNEKIGTNDKTPFGKLGKLYSVELKAGKSYTIDLASRAFDSYLYLFDGKSKLLAQDDDSAGKQNARIVFRTECDGVYHILVTSFRGKGTGEFSLSVR